MKVPLFFMGCLALLLLAGPVHAETLAERVSGYVLLDVENNGEAWYVSPPTLERYYLGRPADAFSIMRALGLGITDEDLANIPTESDTFTGDLALRERLSGRILLQVEEHGEAWYVYPGSLKRYYLGRPDDAFALMQELGLGITQTDLAQIPIAPAIVPETSQYESYTLTLPQGAFDVRVLTLNRNAFAMVTDTAEQSDCNDGCAAKSLATYVQENGAAIGLHGTYFCPPDYASCAGKTNTFLSPVYNSAAGVMLNEDSLAVHVGPMLVYTTDGDYLFFHRTKDFGTSVAAFESRTGKQLSGAIANYPSLVENGEVIVWNETRMDDSQRTVKGLRGGIGFDQDQLFLVIASSATVPDLAYIFQALGATDAMNLDGGGSAALYDHGVYRYGPGRLLPNAITFTEKP